MLIPKKAKGKTVTAYALIIVGMLSATGYLIYKNYFTSSSVAPSNLPVMPAETTQPAMAVPIPQIKVPADTASTSTSTVPEKNNKFLNSDFFTSSKFKALENNIPLNGSSTPAGKTDPFKP